jgi:hypothetical protein
MEAAYSDADVIGVQYHSTFGNSLVQLWFEESLTTQKGSVLPNPSSIFQFSIFMISFTILALLKLLQQN